ncbi:hypothetical protein [Labilithrix luteola]|nr:hypothetical protein [Labilithrix luteola]
MAKAKSQAGGQYVKGEGKFLVTIQRIFVHEGHKGRFFICEFSVDESTSPLDPAGSTRSWSAPLLGERAKYSFGDIKNLIFAVTGHHPKDVADPDLNPELHNEATRLVMAAVDPAYAKKNDLDATILIGEQVQLETNLKATRPKPGQTQGGTFTVHSWSPASAGEAVA